MTEDSDLIAYGVTKLLKGLQKNGDCKILDLTKSSSSDNRNVQHFFKLSLFTRINTQKICLYSLRL